MAGDVEVGIPDGTHDHVVCHNLLHRVRNPIAVIERLIDACGSTLTIELTGPEDVRPRRLLRRDYGVLQPIQDVLASLPVTVVGRHGTPTRKREQKFFFSPMAMHNMLMEHRRVFASIDVATAGPGAYVITATRRRIGRLLLVSGPTGSGKSTLLARAAAGQPDAVGAVSACGWDISPSAVVAGSGSLASLPVDVPEVLFHYDLLRPWQRDARVHARDEALDVVASAREVRAVVMIAPAAELRARLLDELAAIDDPASRAAARLRTVVDLYGEPDRTCSRIQDFVDHCGVLAISIAFVESHGEYRIIDQAAWRSVVRG